MHAFGYSRTILVPENVSELETLLNEDLIHCETIRASRGKILFKIPNDDQVQRDLVHNRIKDLTFIPYNKNVHLPLITRSDNVLITVYCDIDFNIRWDKFLVQFARQNNLCASFWRGDNFEAVPQEDGKFRMTFNVDGLSLDEIQTEGRNLNFRRSRVHIEVENNALWSDIQQLRL